MRASAVNHWTMRCAGLALLASCGCATFWDDVSARPFNLSRVFERQDPLVVLRDSDDGTKRARALEALSEPLANGGSQQDQELFMKILTTTALTDRDSYCRLAAVRSLGRFKDPRAAETLHDVYLQSLPFSAEMNTMVRQQVLASLAETRHDVALDLLIRVAKEPHAVGSMKDWQESLDRRLNAIRGLGSFKHQGANDALLHILKTEQDAALRDRAQEALRKTTGKNLPADAVAWEQHLYPNRVPDQGVVDAGHMSGGIGDWLMKAVWLKK